MNTFWDQSALFLKASGDFPVFLVLIEMDYLVNRIARYQHE